MLVVVPQAEDGGISNRTEPHEVSKRAFPWKQLVAAVVVASLIWLRSHLPIAGWLESFNVWVAGLGPKGMIVYVAAYVLATVLFVPGSIITLAAGFLFGVVRGTILVSIGSTTSAALAFLVSRYFAREWVAKRASENKSFVAIDRAIVRQGWKIVGLLRLSPVIPFNLSNYLYGLTAVQFLPYVIASWIGMLPGTILYVYLGATGKAGLQVGAGDGDKTWQEFLLLGIGLMATVVVTIMITRIAKRALVEASVEDGGSEGEPAS